MDIGVAISLAQIFPALGTAALAFRFLHLLLHLTLNSPPKAAH